jgi:hypothetical protein
MEFAGICFGAVDLRASGSKAGAELLLVALEHPVDARGGEYGGNDAVVGEVQEAGGGHLHPEINKDAAPVRKPRLCTHPHGYCFGPGVGVGAIA